MSQIQTMPLWRDANRLLLIIEQGMRYFPRYHMVALGQDLRHQALGICRLINLPYQLT